MSATSDGSVWEEAGEFGEAADESATAVAISTAVAGSDESEDAGEEDDDKEAVDESAADATGAGVAGKRNRSKDCNRAECAERAFGLRLSHRDMSAACVSPTMASATSRVTPATIDTGRQHLPPPPPLAASSSLADTQCVCTAGASICGADEAMARHALSPAKSSHTSEASRRDSRCLLWEKAGRRFRRPVAAPGGGGLPWRHIFRPMTLAPSFKPNAICPAQSCLWRAAAASALR